MRRRRMDEIEGRSDHRGIAALRAAVAAAAVLALAILSACGGSDSAGDETAAATVVGAAAAAATAVGDDTAAATTAAGNVVTEQGSGATLTVPPGALPAGVSIDQISIERIDPSTVSSTPNDLVAVFRLLPDGLEFASPALLSFVADIPPDAGLLGFVVAGDTVTGLEADAITLRPDPDTGLTRVTAEIDHFSTQYFSKVDFRFTFTPEAISDQPVGATFEVSGRVSPPGGELLIINGIQIGDGPLRVVIESAATADMRGWSGVFGEWRAGGVVSPSRAQSRDNTRYPPNAGQSFPSQSFTCTAPGEFTIGVSVSVGLTLNVTHQTFISGRPPSTPSTVTWGLSTATEAAVWGASCVMPRIVATLTAPLTTYTLLPALPDVPNDGIEYAWTGADCGTTTGDTAATYVWSHGDEDCVHFGESHPDATILLVVTVTIPDSGEVFELRCPYISAATGEGTPCEQRR